MEGEQVKKIMRSIKVREWEGRWQGERSILIWEKETEMAGRREHPSKGEKRGLKKNEEKDS